MSGPNQDPQTGPNLQEVEELRKELEVKEQESKQKGLPFNRTALLRRIAQTKGRYYDSAEFVLRNGFPSANSNYMPQTNQPAYFQNPVSHQGPMKSRFHQAASVEEEDE